MARPNELKQYKGIDVIYGLYTDEEGIRYIGYSKDEIDMICKREAKKEYDGV